MGILNVDKPLHWTSHDVVGLVRRLARLRQVGHAGTLDPLATGVLLLMLGPATRLSDELMHAGKCYQARLHLGITTRTDDREGEVVTTRAVGNLTRAQAVAALSGFRGEIEQVPPAYAAIKQGGVPVYKLARQGQEPVLAPRRVRIDALAVTGLDTDAATLDILVWCGAGTYIRALARDVGEVLGCGAHLAALRRLSSGRFGVDSAVGVEDLRRHAEEGTLATLLSPLDAAVSDRPAVILDDADARMAAHGRVIPVDEDEAPALLNRISDAALYTRDGTLAALARYDAQRGGWQPTKVFAPPGVENPA